MWLQLHPPPGFVAWTKGEGLHTQKNGAAIEIADYLTEYLQSGDKVQPLDWTGGVVHAMLLAGAQPATEFLYDFHFYHHVSEPYIQVLRQRFIRQLEKKRPRFIVQYTGDDKPWPKGEETTRDFPELQRILSSDYEVVKTGEKYRIFEIMSDTITPLHTTEAIG
jgi:hypothetical protein